METPDPPNDTPGALKHVVFTPHDIPWSLRVQPLNVPTLENPHVGKSDPGKKRSETVGMAE